MELPYKKTHAATSLNTNFPPVRHYPTTTIYNYALTSYKITDQWRAEDCSFFPSFMTYTMVYTQYRSFFLSSTTFPTFHVCYYSTHGSVLLVLPLADGFHGLRGP